MNIYDSYHKTVNMTYSDLKQWSLTDCSKKASLDRSPIKRNLELLKTPESKWTEKHTRWAKKTISFIKRMRKGKQGKKLSNCNLSKRDIALRNWAYKR